LSHNLDSLAFKFFKLFAQYEYALKVMQFARSGSGDQAEPNWDRFANEIGHLVMENPEEELKKAIDYIFEHPPKKQVLSNGALTWQEMPNNERSPQILYSHIRRVRNNLYHGGKFNGRWFDPDRSEELIGKSLLILNSLKEKHAQLSDAIHGNHA